MIVLFKIIQLMPNNTAIILRNLKKLLCLFYYFKILPLKDSLFLTEYNINIKLYITNIKLNNINTR